RSTNRSLVSTSTTRRRSASVSLLSRSSGPARSMWLPALSIHHVRSALRRSRSALLALLVGVRSLGQRLQESVRFSHDVQGGLGGVQPLVCASEFAGEPRDLGLFGGEPANLLSPPFSAQHPRVAF